MALTPLPPAPSILAPETFSEDADAFVAALGTLVTELNAIIGLTIPAGSAAASTLTGSTLAANVLASSLTSLGTIASFIAGTITASGVATLASVAGAAVATQANQEAATSVATVVTPGRQQFHPSAAKAWGYVTYSGGVPTLQASFNISGITDNGVGDLIFAVNIDLSTANYVAVSDALYGGGSGITSTVYSLAAGSVRVLVVDNGAGGGPAQFDPTGVFLVIFGDQA